MVTTVVDKNSGPAGTGGSSKSGNLAIVRRLEAAGFRAWPAATIQYDGSWQIRLTAGHPSKRLNSVNPLDPSDRRDIEKRVEKAARRFESYDRRLVFRMSPLAPPELEAYLEELNWERFEETIVMMAPMTALDIEQRMDHLPMRDIGRYVDASILVHGREPTLKAGLTEILSSIRPQSGLFVIEEEESGPLSTALCVHDTDLAGIYELATRIDVRGQGHGREVVCAALRWARHRGALHGWLQVESGNEAALALYQSLGFREVYRYAFRRNPTA